MAVTHKYAIATFDHDKISEIDEIIVKYYENITKSSSHILFDIKPINPTDVVEDLTFFRIIAENESEANDIFNKMVAEMDTVDTDYSIWNEETRDVFTTINHIGALDIKFDKIHTIEKGTYKSIDELKNMRTEFGYCKGYKPSFRPLEERPIENLEVPKESIYLFSKTSEEYSKLTDFLSEKIMAINPDFELETRIFK